MNRLKFLETLLVLPVGIFLVHCSSDSSYAGGSAGSGGSSGDPNAPAAAPAKAGDLTTYTSSNAGSHHHTFSIDDADLASPPAAGVSGDSSKDGGHTHGVTVSADDLARLATGESIHVTSASAGSHTHVFTFVKVG